MMMSRMFLKSVFAGFKPSANSRCFKRLMQLIRAEKQGNMFNDGYFKKYSKLRVYTGLITSYPQLIFELTEYF